MKNSPSTIANFAAELSSADVGFTVKIDAPDDPAGETWFDLKKGVFKTSVSYRPLHGFGVYVTASGFGEGPEEIYKTPEKATKRLQQLYAAAANNLAPTPPRLADIRALLGRTQNQVADALDMTQPSVQRTEQHTNPQFQTVANYIDAIGGHLEVRAVFDDMEVELAIGEEQGSKKK